MVNSLIETNNHETLVRMLARHRPIVGPLWLGAILTGLSRDIPNFLRTLEAPYARPDSLASAWLELPQLFIDTPGIGAYKCDDYQIRRADRWRLLHDVGLKPYCNTPLSSWQPFGLMPLSAVEIDVMAHVDCKRHKKQYIRWDWKGQHGTDILGTQRIYDDSNVDRTRSVLTKWAAAIRRKLTWFTVRGMGWQMGGRMIDNHPWAKGLIRRIQNSGAGGIPNATGSIKDLHHLEPDYPQASIAATRSIFAWLTVGGEGWGESEGPIYEHPWMAELIPTDTDESAFNGSWEGNDYSD
ncbi:hypothetical protein MMC18_008814 [Xylographa bjoerkii]|nr:hypothetical protein [Xylographa bjoerkii]